MRKSYFILSVLLVTGLYAGEKYNLEECLDIALKNNPDLMISQKQSDISINQKAQAFGSFLPTVGAGLNSSFSAQGQREFMSGGMKIIQPETNSEYYSLGVNVNQPIFNSAIFSGYKLAKNGVVQAGISKNQTRQYLISSITEKFYAYLKAQELLKVYEKAHSNSFEQLKKTEEMHRLGQVTKKDVLKAKVREGGDRLNIINQKQALETAGIDLRASMGLKPDGSDFSAYEKIYTVVKSIDLQTAQEYCFKNNLALKLLDEQRRSADLQIKMAKSAYLPTLSSSFSYSRGGNQADRIYSETDKWWNRSLSLNLGFSIFNGFKTKKNVQIKKIEYNIYDERIRKEKISLMSRLDGLVRTLNTYKDMLEINEINLNSAREDLRLAQEMYKLNSATFLEVLDAQTAFTRAESDIIRIKYEMKVIEVQLKLTMGTL